MSFDFHSVKPYSNNVGPEIHFGMPSPVEMNAHIHSWMWTPIELEPSICSQITLFDFRIRWYRLKYLFFHHVYIISTSYRYFSEMLFELCWPVRFCLFASGHRYYSWWHAGVQHLFLNRHINDKRAPASNGYHLFAQDYSNLVVLHRSFLLCTLNYKYSYFMLHEGREPGYSHVLNDTKLVVSLFQTCGLLPTLVYLASKRFLHLARIPPELETCVRK